MSIPDLSPRRLVNLSAAPAAAALGDVYYDTTLAAARVCTNATGPVFTSLGGGGGSSAYGVQGAKKNLTMSTTGTATVTLSLDEILLENPSNAYLTGRTLALTAALTTSGVNGLDNTIPQSCTISIASPAVVTLSGHGYAAGAAIKFAGTVPTGLVAGTTYYVKPLTAGTFNVSATSGGTSINTTAGTSSATVVSVLAKSSWYSVWVIYNGTTFSLLLSSSATNPILPTGYTYKARTGWVFTDATVNMYPVPISQLDDNCLYTTGYYTVGSLGLNSIAPFVPPTAKAALLAVNCTDGTGMTLAVPSASSPVSLSTGQATVILFANIPLTPAMTIYIGGSGSGTVSVTGWIDRF